MTEMTPWQLFLMGGPLMWPILLCSVFSLTIIIQKMSGLFILSRDTQLLEQKVLTAVRGNGIKEAIIICDKHPVPLAIVFKSGLLKYSTSRNEIVDAMQEAIKFEIPLLEKGMSSLSTIVTLAPLMGFLGTVVGLCHAFHMVQIRAAALNPLTSGDIAYGIWQALISTAGGLTVGAIALVVHNYLVAQIFQTVRSMERAASDLLELMTSSFEPLESTHKEQP